MTPDRDHVRTEQLSVVGITYYVCRLALKEWVVKVRRANVLPQFEDSYDDLADPLEALCSTAQVVAMKLAEDRRLETTLERARKFKSVQQRATALAKKLGFM